MPRIQPIREFLGKFGFLSNFYVEPDGSIVEKEYQAAKCLWPEDAQRILRCQDAATARKLGRTYQLRPTWSREEKLGVMTGLVYQKFTDHPDLAAKLRHTDHAHLEERNWWGDRFWGTHNGTGENQLGKILMWVREELR